MPTPTFDSLTYAAKLTEKFADEGEFASRFFTAVAPKAGRGRWDKIMQGPTRDKMTSIHAFVERETGFVFKAAGLNKPAKGIRYQDVLKAVAASDLYGSYLYK